MVYAEGGSGRTKNVDTTRRERETFVLEDEEILQLARWAVVIEKHYGRPMDVEWAQDGETGELAIVQARPETVQSLQGSAPLKVYRRSEEHTSELQSLMRSSYAVFCLKKKNTERE